MYASKVLKREREDSIGAYFPPTFSRTTQWHSNRITVHIPTSSYFNALFPFKLTDVIPTDITVDVE